MTDKTPANEALRIKDGVIDQRQQQIDPAGKHRDDPNANGGKLPRRGDNNAEDQSEILTNGQ